MSSNDRFIKSVVQLLLSMIVINNSWVAWNKLYLPLNYSFFKYAQQKMYGVALSSYWLLLIMASPLDLKTACSLLEQGPLGKNWKDCNASQLPKYNAVWPDISNSLHGSSFLKRHNSASPSSIWMRQKMPSSGTCCSHPMRLRLDNVVWSKPVAFSMPPLNFPSKDPCWHVLSSEHTATNSHAHSDSRKPDRNCCPEKGPY